MNQFENKTIKWLLDSDVSMQYHVHKDLLKSGRKILKKLQNRIEKQGWGRHFLLNQNENGHWGMGFYQPKWISTHYTLLDLKNLGLSGDNAQVKKSIKMIFNETIGNDGGINYARTPKNRMRSSDVCCNGMVMNIASYFKVLNPQMKIIIDLFLSLQMKDGGWNCEWYNGAKHSSLHTTISVLEGLFEYVNSGEMYKEKKIKIAQARAVEFILEHQLFKSHRTGEVIDKKMTMLSYPSRWRYDILRALDYFYFSNIPFDERMKPALDILVKKQKKNGWWPLQNKHPGQVHFDMEKTGSDSRWNTLRALRVLNYYNIETKIYE